MDQLEEDIRERVQEDDEFLSDLAQCISEGHVLREGREQLGYRSELVIAGLHMRLNDLYHAIQEGKSLKEIRDNEEDTSSNSNHDQG